MHVVFVTGLSGAGKSQTMKTFEDLGFYCMDNLPPALASSALELLDRARVVRVAIALDVRSGGPLGDALGQIDRARAPDRRVDVLFLDAREDALVRRYSETRRRHPFASAGSLRDAIALERNAFAALRERADYELDTTGFTHATLKDRIAQLFASSADHRALAINLIAFGFKFGIPLDADLLFDVRFLRNPHYVPELEPLNGSDPAVAAFIEGDSALEPFLERTFALLDFLIPRYVAEGKAMLTIGIGCTGGRHRSVYVATRFAQHLDRNDQLNTTLELRDVIR
jgi:UPF0042 nucleotide-binding protein